VFITTGHNTLGQDTALKYTDMGVNDPYLANADGYTRWMNPVEFSEDGKMWTFKPGAKGVGTDFDGTLNGYKYFASGLGATDDLYDFFSNPANLHNRGEFLAGAKNTRRYDLYFPMTGVGGTPLIKFQYAVVASWKPAGSIDPGDLPGSFPPDANQQECFMLSVADNSTLYYTPSVAGGDLKLQLEIFNWAPHLGASSTVLSDIDKIVIESPQGILPTPYVEIDAASLAPTAMPGTTDASSIVGIDIAGCTPKDVMGQQAIITIRQAGKGYDNDGMGTNYPGVSLAAYFFHALEVSIIGPQNDKVKVTSIDPDHGIPDTHMYDVVVTGENFGGVTELKLVGDTGETTAINLTVTDSKHLACELDFSGLAVGLYDVVAHDPIVGDGVLPDGFKLMDCPGGIQNTLTLYSTNVAYDPLFVAGVFTSGAYAGQIITQQNANAWNRIDVAVPPTDDTPVYYFADKPSLDPYTTDWSWSLDCDPLHEIFAFTTFDDDTNTTDQWPNTEFDFVKVCNQSDGSYLGACDTNAGYIVAQVDVDERGNIWSIDANDYPWSEGGYDNHYTIERWNYDASAPAPYYTKAGEWDISDVIGPDACISDILVLQRYRRLYVSCSSQTADWGVEIHSWDISQDPPVHLNDAFETATGFYGTDSFQEAHQRFVDMEVDRSDDVLAGCRFNPGLARSSSGKWIWT
jgi:hypothetical protein